MALGVIRVRGNLCQYSGGGKGKKGKFTSCKGKRITGGKKKAARKTASKKRSRGGCKKTVVDNYGNKTCRTVCRNKKGEITSSKPTTGCKW